MSYIDKITGEIKENNKEIFLSAPEDVSIIFTRKKQKDRRDFVKVYTEDLLLLTKNIKSLSTLKVFNVLLAHIDYDGSINLSMSEIGKILSIKKQQVNRSIKDLESKNIISIEKKGRNNVYHINNSVAWKGNVKSLEDSKYQNFKIVK